MNNAGLVKCRYCSTFISCKDFVCFRCKAEVRDDLAQPFAIFWRTAALLLLIALAGYFIFGFLPALLALVCSVVIGVSAILILGTAAVTGTLLVSAAKVARVAASLTNKKAGATDAAPARVKG